MATISQIYDFHDFDLEPYKIKFTPAYEKVERELYKLRLRKSHREEADTAEKGDLATVSLRSEMEKFNKENIVISLGTGLFNREFEEKLVGHHVGETFETETDGRPVTVVLHGISRNCLPELCDSMVEELQMDGIKTVEDYREYLIQKQRDELLYEEEYPVTEKVLSTVIEKSGVRLSYEEWKEDVEDTLNRMRRLAAMSELVLEEMTPEEFDGRIPVKSYHELVAMVQEEAWNRTAASVIGREMAKKDGVSFGEEAYRRFLEDYAKTWQYTIEEAGYIHAYEPYIRQSYADYLYKSVSDHVRKNMLTEA